jgi:hypothetical protein
MALASASVLALLGMVVAFLAWSTRAGRRTPQSLHEASLIASRPIRKVGP